MPYIEIFLTSDYLKKIDVVDLTATTIKTIGGIEDRLFILGKQACDVDLKSPVLIVENKNSKKEIRQVQISRTCRYMVFQKLN